ncbi:MarR family winged helix-turn-helix transcriptional regulator [Castellaniella sp.]|uniref:MarR family winged helix-turn-helix transcriptional regulator n=1 Tax=Castellaniella sp. TaxID=1955812 RepID=UPI003C73A533
MIATSTPRSRFGIRFSLLARRWRRRLDAHLAQAGLTDATWVPLIHLDETGGGMTQKDLALLVGVDGSSLVRVLDILERQGLIERRRSETDGRARLVHLTPDGKRRVAGIRQELGAGERALLSGLSEDEIDTLLRCFDRIDERIAALENAAPPPPQSQAAQHVR